MEGVAYLSFLIVCSFYYPATASIYGDLINTRIAPYFAYLTEGYTTTFKCGGAIIHDRFILTAAHCLNDRYFNVFVGVNMEEDLKVLTPYAVEEVRKFPWYDQTIYYDVGLVKLTTHLVRSDRVQPISLETRFPPMGAEVSIIGFGLVDCTNNPKLTQYHLCSRVRSRYLRSAKVTVSGMQNRVLYTSTRSRYGCSGDSGGPVVYNGKLVAVVTTGPHNSCHTQDAQVLISEKYQWIKDTMKQLS
ncbi:kallikrein-related [Holotrichia oblita]|uniref:Kallikrein-related n=1 Tax=Holotrichia oblita TaxID=644536 RepID=A0ACB9SGU7_HOLOL|nr:kallikrein-related [Holotrichia oblita]